MQTLQITEKAHSFQEQTAKHKKIHERNLSCKNYYQICKNYTRKKNSKN